MARKISRKNGAAWGTAKGLWGTVDGVSWLPAKKAWANHAGAWAQVWPPDMAFTSFAVTATTGEVGYTSSLISWNINTSVPGTVSIQRLAPGGSWTDINTGLAVSGSYTQTPLAPANSAAGTWTYRAVFIPTYDPTWLTYSSTDTVSLTWATVTLTVTATTGEVFYTSSNMTWNAGGGLAGTVKLQRKLGAGSWSDFATGLAKSGSASHVLAPAGAANNGTWYYRAVFIPTVDPTWNILSAEDSATLTFRSIGTAPSNVEPWYNDAYSDWDEWNLWPIRGPISVGEVASILVPYAYVGTMPYADLSHINVTFNGNDGYYTWMSGGTVAYSKGQDQGNVTFTCGASYASDTEGRKFSHQSGTTYASICGGWRTLPLPGVGSPTWGVGFNLMNSDGSGTAQFVFKDGQSHTVSIAPQLAVG